MGVLCHIILTLALASLGAAAPAVAVRAETEPGAHGARTDFSGRWVPDYERWRGIERLLELQDAGWLVRRSFKRIDAVEEIEQTDDSLTISLEVALPIASKQRRYRLDNRTRRERTPLGRDSRVRHYWDGSTLVHVRQLEDEDGRPVTLVARRRLLEAGDTMQVEIVARGPDGEEHRALQIYERES